MGLPFLMSVLTGLVAVWYLVVARLDLENLRVQSAARLGGYPRT